MQTRRAHIFCEVKWKTIEERRNKMAAGDDAPGDVFKLLGEDGLKIMTKLINTFMKLESGPKTSRKLQ